MPMATPAAGKSLYVQVLVAIALGALVGHFYPHVGEDLKPLGDVFIRLIKMVIAPIVFTTIVVGIASMGDLKKVGRIGLKAIVYFEVVATLASAIGLVVVNVAKPGAGVNANAAALDARAVASYVSTGHSLHGVDAILGVIPTNVVDAFAKGEILQILLFSILFGFAIAAMGEKGRPLVELLDRLAHAFFGVVALVMRIAPVGAFGAMAFTVGKYGIGTLANLAKLMATFYATAALFVALVLGAIARAAGFSLWRLIVYIKDEIMIVLGTSSSESVLPRMMQKLEALGCSRSVVGLVVPTGYSFNLDGTSIYLTTAAIFVAQATNTPLTTAEQLHVLGILLLTSKGAAAVTGGGFVTLAATLASMGRIPVAGLTLLLGIDRFMSEARAITNLVGNAVATIVVARWEKEFDVERAHQVLHSRSEP